MPTPLDQFAESPQRVALMTSYAVSGGFQSPLPVTEAAADAAAWWPYYTGAWFLQDAATALDGRFAHQYYLGQPVDAVIAALPQRVQNVIRRAGYFTASQVAHLPDEVIAAWRNCGIGTLRQIRAAIPAAVVPALPATKQVCPTCHGSGYVWPTVEAD